MAARLPLPLCVWEVTLWGVAVISQLLMCRRGEDIILVTLNHLDTIRKLVGDSDHHRGLIDASIKTLVEVSVILRIYRGDSE